MWVRKDVFAQAQKLHCRRCTSHGHQLLLCASRGATMLSVSEAPQVDVDAVVVVADMIANVVAYSLARCCQLSWPNR